ncbi:hypothetical protein AB0N99_30750 [Streptomyces sp. NPDC093272]|uniref:hypothetical protein n=1 Tax=Streptomyces sp. NPDC093272 TaxID=3154981 RepID=UPI00343D412F
MPGKIWKPTRRDMNDLKRHIRKGTVVYTVRQCVNTFPNGLPIPYRDKHYYAAHEFTWRSPITGSWMTSHMSVEALFAESVDGLVYERPPAGMKEIGTPAPQVSGPLGDGYEGVLDEAEIGGLWKQVRDGSNPRTRRAPGSWRV